MIQLQKEFLKYTNLDLLSFIKDLQHWLLSLDMSPVEKLFPILRDLLSCLSVYALFRIIAVSDFTLFIFLAQGTHGLCLLSLCLPILSILSSSMQMPGRSQLELHGTCMEFKYFF